MRSFAIRAVNPKPISDNCLPTPCHGVTNKYPALFKLAVQLTFSMLSHVLMNPIGINLKPVSDNCLHIPLTDKYPALFKLAVQLTFSMLSHVLMKSHWHQS